MLKIVVCDDEAGDRERIVELLQGYLAMRNQKARITQFSDGQSLLDAPESDYDLYLLDVLMPGMDGIQTGTALRRYGRRGEIIYLTSSREYAVDSYDVGAFYYLVKPVQREKLFSVLDALMKKVGRRQEEGIVVPTAQGRRRILLENICYVERVGRVACYCCAKERVETLSLQVSFKETVEPLLQYPQFYPCGVSYVLNLRHVSMVNGQNAQMDNGDVITLPRGSAVAFKHAWGNYWLEEDSE